ncbi:hypothetical protein ACKWTF_004579 [Chironomus riparius]
MPRRRKVTVDEQENKEPEVKAPSKSKKTKEPLPPAKKLKLQPEWLIGDGLNIAKIILSVQKTDCNSNKCLTELQKLYKKMQHSSFMKSFLMTLRSFLTQEDGNEYSLRVLKFIGVFIASYGEEVTDSGASHPVVESSFNELLGITSSQVHIRARICNLVTSIMTSFSQKAELDETIIEKITERMLYFMRDTSPIVRAQAIVALQRLQDPENVNEDPVTKAYVHHMESDPAVKVRQSVITAIAKKNYNIPLILERLHDVDEKVRRHTYLQMSSYSVRSYKIVDRIAILNAGLNDRSDLVRKAVTNVLLSNWIGVYEFDYAEFIRAIKLDSTEKDLTKFRTLAEMALSEIFKKRKISDIVSYLDFPENNEYKNCINVEKTNLEQLIVWKMAIKSYQDYIDGKRSENIGAPNDVADEDDEEEEVVNKTVSNIDIIPELSVFCDYVDRFINDYKFGTDNEVKLQRMYFNQCIVTLLEIVQLYDLGDEVGKNSLLELLKSLMSNFDLSEFSVQEIAKLAEKIIPSVEQRLTYFNKIIFEMVKPGSPSEYSRQTIIDELINKSDIDRKVKANDIKLKMMDLKEQESMLVQRKQYAECQRVSEQYHKLNEELIDLLRPIAEQHSVESTQSLLENLTVHANIKKITPQEIIKNLKICYYSITSKGVKSMNHDVLQIYNEFVRYYLESTDLSTRIWALKTATAYSLLYESIAKEIYIILKSQVFKSVHVLLWECSIECIFDLLLRYSVEKMDGFDNNDASLSMTQNRSKKGGRTLYTDIDPDDEDAVDEMYIIKTLDIMQMLTHLMEQSVDKKILKITIHGMCKMILHGIYSTRELLSKFLLMYFNPATDSEISQLLGIFLENLIKRKKQELLHDALVPTILTLFEAPYDSPLREVKLETVLKYIVGATRPIFCSNGLNLHNTLSMKFVELMKDNPDSKEILKVFSKELLELEIGEDPLLKKDLFKQVEQLLKDSSADVRTKKYLSDFCKILNGTYRPPLKFSSTARTQIDDEEDENPVDEEETVPNEEEEAQSTVPTIQELPEEEINDISGQDVSMSDVKLKEFDVNVTKLDVNFEMNDLVPTTSTTSTNNDASTSRLEVNETLSESIEIPATQEHAEVNETNVEHEDIPATQAVDLTEIPTTEDESAEEVSSDEIIPPSPATPLTVVKRPGIGIRGRKAKNSVDTLSEENEEYPATPISTNKKSVINKRQLEISRSTPNTPSVSSPMRKNARKITVTPKSAPNTPTTSQESKIVSTPKTPSTPRRTQSLMQTTPARLSTLPPSKVSTPNTEGRMTRSLRKIEKAQNITVTRATAKTLNVKPTKQPENDTEAKKKPTTSKLPVKRGFPVPAKIVTAKTSTISTRPVRQVTKPESKAAKDTRPRWN